MAAQPVYPTQYFRNPLNIPIQLAGNFGECRPGHFHSGIDIKTNGKENLPVYAAADGYVSRIKMEPGGFGHGLYITHPNGYTTLYAHLNNFTPVLQQYVRSQQYTRQSWTVDLTFPPGQFPVKKGQQIAFSGNTGGSTAPHLHFEIRDTKTEHPLNPQLFGFTIKDTQPPVPTALYLYSGEAAGGFYELMPKPYALTKKGTIYKPAKDTLVVPAGDDLVQMGIVANDFMNGSTNTLAFYTAEWTVDDQSQGRVRLDNIGYEETRYVNAYADYRTKQKGGPWVQCLFRLPGNRLNKIYEAMDGTPVGLSDGRPHRVLIRLADVYGNKSEIAFAVKTSPALSKSTGINSENCQGLDYNKKQTAGSSGVSLSLNDDALYDKVCAVISDRHEAQGLSARYRVHYPEIPVHSYFDLRIKPDKFISFADRDKVALVYNNGKKDEGKAARPDDKGWYKASVRNFGEYRLVADTDGPVIKPAAAWQADQGKAKRITFVVKDGITSVRSFRGELDGEWILFEQHENNWFYEFDSHCAKGSHVLVVTAKDENGNETSASYNFKR